MGMGQRGCPFGPCYDVFGKEVGMIYAISDVHGCVDALEEALSFVDLTDGQSRLIVCGDLCDRGPASLQVFHRIMGLQREFPDQVVVLRGNHEEMLLEYVAMVGDPCFTRAWMLSDSNLATAKSFLSNEFDQVKRLLARRKFEEAYRFVVGCMKSEHSDVLAWIKALPYYFETPKQIFVHAGVEEDARDLWRIGTPVEFFTAMPPDYVGKKFDLDVIAGHIDTETVSGIPGYQGVWYDGASHYYIDGGVMRTGCIPVLAYDEEADTYSEISSRGSRQLKAV